MPPVKNSQAAVIDACANHTDGRYLHPVTWIGRLLDRLLDDRRVFARDVMANLLANGVAAAIAYLALIVFGLLKPSAWLTVFSLVIIAIGSMVISDLIVDHGGYNVRRVSWGLEIATGLAVAIYPWFTPHSLVDRIGRVVLGIGLVLVSGWLLVSHLRRPWAPIKRRWRRPRFPTMTWYQERPAQQQQD
jgi:hypothetical protein